MDETIGFDTDLVIGDTDDVLCMICHKVVEMAVENECGHVFCRPHLESWQQHSGEPACPICRHNIRVKPEIHFLYRKQLSNLKIKCEYHIYGCPVGEMDLALFRAHVSKCTYVPKRCKWCSAMLAEETAEEHEESCPWKGLLERNRSPTAGYLDEDVLGDDDESVVTGFNFSSWRCSSCGVCNVDDDFSSPRMCDGCGHVEARQRSGSMRRGRFSGARDVHLGVNSFSATDAAAADTLPENDQQRMEPSASGSNDAFFASSGTQESRVDAAAAVADEIADWLGEIALDVVDDNDIIDVTPLNQTISTEASRENNTYADEETLLLNDSVETIESTTDSLLDHYEDLFEDSTLAMRLPVSPNDRGHELMRRHTLASFKTHDKNIQAEPIRPSVSTSLVHHTLSLEDFSRGAAFHGLHTSPLTLRRNMSLSESARQFKPNLIGGHRPGITRPTEGSTSGNSSTSISTSNELDSPDRLLRPPGSPQRPLISSSAEGRNFKIGVRDAGGNAPSLYDTPSVRVLSYPVFPETQEQQPRLVKVRRDADGFGFRLSRVDNVHFLRAVDRGGPCDREGCVEGDIILAAGPGGQLFPVEHLSHQALVNNIRSWDTMTLLVVTPTDFRVQTKEEQTPLLPVQEGRDAYRNNQSRVDPVRDSQASMSLDPQERSFVPRLTLVRHKISTVSLDESIQYGFDELDGSEMDVSEVPKVDLYLHSSERGFGFNLTRVGTDHVIRIVDEGGPADQAGVCPGDIVLAVNDTFVEQLSHSETVKLIRDSVNPVKITLSPGISVAPLD